MRINNISQPQNQQNFGQLKIPDKECKSYLLKVMNGDAEFINLFADTFCKIEEQQALNPLFDIELKIGASAGKKISDISSHVLVNIFKKGEEAPVATFRSSRNLMTSDEKVKSEARKEKKGILKALEDANDYATKSADMNKLFTMVIKRLKNGKTI